MTLTIPDVPPSLNVFLNLHWRNQQKLKDKWRMLVRTQILPSSVQPSPKTRAKIIFYHARMYDKDNRYGAAKPLVDALKHWNLIAEDSDKYLELTVEQEKCPHKQRHTIIELEAIEL